MARRRSSSVGPGDPWTEALAALALLAALGTVLGLLFWGSGAAVSVVTGHGVGPSPTLAVRRVWAGGGLAGTRIMLCHR